MSTVFKHLQFLFIQKDFTTMNHDFIFKHLQWQFFHQTDISQSYKTNDKNIQQQELRWFKVFKSRTRKPHCSKLALYQVA